MKNLLVVLFMFVCTTINASIIASGVCGKSAMWTLDEEGTLVIDGRGKLFHYTSRKVPSWEDYTDSIKVVKVLDGITSIGNDSFNGLTNVVKIVLPSSLKHLSYGWFGGVESLKEIISESPHFCSIDGVLYNQDKTVILKYPAARTGDFEIPDGVQVIGNYAFTFSQLTTLRMPDSIKKIEYAAFATSNIESIHLSSQLKYIGSYVFSNTDKLKSITIPFSVRKIGWGCFEKCSLERVAIDGSVKKIPGQAFWMCKSLQSAELTGSVKKLKNSIFAYSSKLESVTLGKKVRKISDKAFRDCRKLSEIILLSKKTRKALPKTIGSNVRIVEHELE